MFLATDFLLAIITESAEVWKTHSSRATNWPCFTYGLVYSCSYLSGYPRDIQVSRGGSIIPWGGERV